MTVAVMNLVFLVWQREAGVLFEVSLKDEDGDGTPGAPGWSCRLGDPAFSGGEWWSAEGRLGETGQVYPQPAGFMFAGAAPTRGRLE